MPTPRLTEVFLIRESSRMGPFKPISGSPAGKAWLKSHPQSDDDTTIIFTISTKLYIVWKNDALFELHKWDGTKWVQMKPAGLTGEVARLYEMAVESLQGHPLDQGNMDADAYHDDRSHDSKCDACGKMADELNQRDDIPIQGKPGKVAWICNDCNDNGIA